MRGSLAAGLLILGAQVAQAGDEIRWPDTAIPVPPFVHDFILAECLDYAGSSEEDLDACVAGERLGYRAVVMMLSNSETAEDAAERYRACRVGLGMHGGRFHRRRAECIGHAFRYIWRFESTSRASLEAPEPPGRIKPRHARLTNPEAQAEEGIGGLSGAED